MKVINLLSYTNVHVEFFGPVIEAGAWFFFFFLVLWVFFSGERGRMLGERHKIFSRVEHPICRLTQKVRKTTRGWGWGLRKTNW